MDLDFQRAYGRDYLSYFGTADRWPMSVQVAVAIRGYISRVPPGRTPDVRPVTAPLGRNDATSRRSCVRSVRGCHR